MTTERTKPEPPATAASTAAPARKRRRRRRWGRIVLVVAALVIVVTQSGVLKYVALPRLRSMLGCDASSGRVFVGLNGSLVINDLQLRVPGVAGEAGRFFRAPKAVLRPDWGALLRGRPRLDSLRIDGATVRVSQGADRSLNVMGLSFGDGAVRPGAMPARLPEIELRDALLQFGEHNGAVYSPLATMRVAGTLIGSPDSPGVYAIDLAEVRPGGADGASIEGEAATGMRLQGSLDTGNETGRIVLRHVDLSDWSERTAPEQAREIWRQIAVRGAISAATFSYGPDLGVVTDFELEGVDLNIPIPADSMPGRSVDGPTPEPSLLAMRGVSGRLRFRPDGLSAELQGWIEDLPCAVTLSTKGYSRNAAIECVIDAQEFDLGEKSGLLPFAPEPVHQLLRRFSGPTARISANIRVTRAAPSPDGSGGRIESIGSVKLENGRMRYESFPYPVEQVRGLIEFTSDRISLVGISGVGPTGARFIASGTVEPDMEGPAIDLLIDGFGIPFDEHLLAALRDIGHDEVARIFNQQAYDRLVAAGLIRTPAQVQAEDAALARLSGASTDAERTERQRLTARKAVPVMQLGGAVDVRVHVTRSSGPEPSLAAAIGVEMGAEGSVSTGGARPGLVSEVFPYPAVFAERLRVAIKGSRVTVEGARLAGLTGGGATLDINMQNAAGNDPALAPDIRIRAESIPVDAMLLHAVRETVRRGRERGANDQPDAGFDPAALMAALNIEGVVSSDARIALNRGGDARYIAEVSFDGLSARPEGGHVLQGVRGRIVLTETGVSVDGVSAQLGPGQVRLDAAAEFSAGGLDLSTLTGTINAEGLPLDAPLAPLARLISPEWATQLADLANRLRPTGLADASLAFSGDGVGRVLVTGAERVGIDAMGGRVGVDAFEGRVELTNQGLRFTDARAQVRFDDEPLASLHVNGRTGGDGDTLIVVAEDFDLGSPALPALLREQGDVGGGGDRGNAANIAGLATLADWVSDHGLTGRAALRLEIERADGRPIVRSARLEPRSLGMRLEGGEVTFDRVEGAVSWDGSGAHIEGLSLFADGWDARLDGRIGIDSGRPGDGELRLSLDAAGIPPSLRAVLTNRIRGVMDALNITCDGSSRVIDARWARVAGNESVDAVVEFTDAGFHAGVAAQNVNGRATVRVRPPDAEHPAGELRVDVDAATLRLAGVRMHDARLELRGDPSGAAIRIPVIRASVHGGAMTGRAAIESRPGSARRFEISCEMAGVRFSDVLADLGAGDDSARAVDRGTLEANLSLTGTLEPEAGSDGERRGRGLVRIQGGDLLAMPGVVKLLELSNLQTPKGEVMDFGYADFFVQGDRMVVSDLSVTSPSLVIRGDGEIVWPELAVRMKFRSQAKNRMAIISDIIEGLRDEFVTTVARGTLYDPRLEFDQLSATRRFLETVFGGRSANPRTRNTP